MKKLLTPVLFFVTSMSLFAQEAAERSFDEVLNDLVAPLANFIAGIIFYSVELGENINVPLVLVWLIAGALFFTIFNRFINVRGFGLSLQVVRGVFTNPNEKGRSHAR